MRAYTACAIVKNLKFDDERIKQVMQIQEKLALTHGRNRKKSAYGLYPSEKIKFPIKYIAKNPQEVMFKPLGFQKEIPASQVEELHPKGREYKHIALGWKKYPFFIDAADKVLCMLPYTNSEDTGRIDEDTKEVFVECTGTELENVKVALNILTAMLADMGGDVYSVDVVYSNKTIATPDLNPWKLKLNLDYVNKVLGLQLGEKQAKMYLERMGYGYEKKNALIPAYRADVLHAVDLIEDIAIAHGYENFKEEIPKIATIAESDKLNAAKDKINELLSGMGLLEVATYDLTSRINEDKALLKNKVVELANALNFDYNVLRSSLFPCFLKIIGENKHYDYPQKIFEIGSVFSHGASETGIIEGDHLCIALSGPGINFTNIKQVFDALAVGFKLDLKLREKDYGFLISGRCGEVLIGGKHAGFIGEVHPQVLVNFDLDYPVALLEIDLDWLKS